MTYAYIIARGAESSKRLGGSRFLDPHLCG